MVSWVCALGSYIVCVCSFRRFTSSNATICVPQVEASMTTLEVAWFPEDLDRCEATIEAGHQKSSSEICWWYFFILFPSNSNEIPSICLRKGSIPDHIVEKAPAMRHLKSERDTWRATLPSDWCRFERQERVVQYGLKFPKTGLACLCGTLSTPILRFEHRASHMNKQKRMQVE